MSRISNSRQSSRKKKKKDEQFFTTTESGGAVYGQGQKSAWIPLKCSLCCEERKEC